MANAEPINPGQEHVGIEPQAPELTGAEAVEYYPSLQSPETSFFGNKRGSALFSNSARFQAFPGPLRCFPACIAVIARCCP